MNKKELTERIFKKQSFLCVGLDTDIKKLPPHLLHEADPIFAFNKAIIDATNEYAVAYKPNLAFYEAQGQQGIEAFAKTVEYIRSRYAEQFIIADAKRGDIGNTSSLYARAFFERYNVDAVTIAPYMGEDSVAPFLGYKGKWAVVLALTSNKGNADFQMMTLSTGERLFEHVLRTSKEWGDEENMMFVAGATNGAFLSSVRRIVPRHFLLVPGIGAQGGSLDDVCRYALTAECGLIVNASRSIIYASPNEDFASRAAEEAAKLQREMAQFL